MSENNPEYNDKYERMGVNPSELYSRQKGLCRLEFIEYDLDGEKVIEDLYCTDGKEYVPTRYLLNPTFECMKCLSTFSLKGKREMTKKLDNISCFMTFLMGLLVHIHTLKKNDEVVSLSMDLDTFIYIEHFLENNTMYSNDIPPIRNNGVVRTLFGVSVFINNKVNPKTIIVSPGEKEFIYK
jgi:hypothetical protein